uniref:NAD_binding_11 domain-containing protein n=1 Tax=Haemonchus contortus TaxID=6289 RepID=A0A7I4Y1T8_HAECO
MSVAMNENCFGASSGAAAYFSGFRQAAPQFVAVYGKELCISIGNLHCTLTSLTSPLSCNSDAWNHLLAKASIKASFEGSEVSSPRISSLIGNGTSPMYEFIERDRKGGYIPGEFVKLLKLISQLQQRSASG